jgi:DNA-binding transcriptional MerR regulator
VIEAYVLRALRDLEVPLEEIRRAADLVRTEFKDPYALARKRIATDGVTLFVQLADESIVHASSRQGTFREVLDGHLRYIDWGRDGTASRLHLRHFPASADVIIDPRFGWGSPVLAESKVKVADIVTL